APGGLEGDVMSIAGSVAWAGEEPVVWVIFIIAKTLSTNANNCKYFNNFRELTIIITNFESAITR
ncbi:MAG: hypothetical protein AAFQ07_15870, partial [Chloroflexota bacterium]